MLRVHPGLKQSHVGRFHVLVCLLVAFSNLLALVVAPQMASAAPSAVSLQMPNQGTPAAPLQTTTSVTYSNSTSGTLTQQTSCTTVLTRTFNVSENITITSLQVGIDVAHTYRGDILVTLISPLGTNAALTARANDGDNNYDVLFDNTNGASLDNDAEDSINDAGFDRTVNVSGALTPFIGENTQGTWTLTFCNDKTGNHSKRHCKQS